MLEVFFLGVFWIPILTSMVVFHIFEENISTNARSGVCTSAGKYSVLPPLY